jgi:hypothetical protein
VFIGTKQDVGKVLLLTVVTCGIYGLYWMYRTAQDVNLALNREAVNPNLVWISILCFPVIFYYWYSLDQALVELGGQRGLPYSSNFILWIVLTVLAGVGTFVAEVQVQSYLNQIWDRGDNVQSGYPPPYGQ